VKPGDLIKTKTGNRIGVIVEIFGDLDPKNPWIRIRWTHPQDAYEWCKQEGLEPAVSKNNKGGD
jgi:rRNA processing protein Gar1